MRHLDGSQTELYGFVFDKWVTTEPSRSFYANQNFSGHFDYCRGVYHAMFPRYLVTSRDPSHRTGTRWSSLLWNRAWQTPKRRNSLDGKNRVAYLMSEWTGELKSVRCDKKWHDLAKAEHGKTGSRQTARRKRPQTREETESTCCFRVRMDDYDLGGVEIERGREGERQGGREGGRERILAGFNLVNAFQVWGYISLDLGANSDLFRLSVD